MNVVKSEGYNLSDIAAVTGRGGENGFFGGDNGWWIILLFLFAGWGRGFGGFGGNRGGNGCSDLYLRSEPEPDP